MPLKRFAVIGGTGGTGRYLVRQLLEAGHSVRSVGRSDAAACDLADTSMAHRLSFLKADITEPAVLQQAAAGMDGVVFAASAGGKDYWKAPLVDYAAVAELALICKAEQTPRMLLVSSILVTEQHRMAPIRLFLNNVMAYGLMDCKLRGENAVRKAGLPSYTICRPGGMGGPIRPDRPLQCPPVHSHVQVDQGDRLRGRIARSDLAAICSEALLSDRTHNTTFEVIQQKPEMTADLAHFAHALEGLSQDEA